MRYIERIAILFVIISFASCIKGDDKLAMSSDTVDTTKDASIERKVEELLSKMTLEEKIGQMNQYNGFWDLTGPAPSEGVAAKKYEHLRKGYVGSMLNVRGVKDVMKVQKIAVEETRLGIPLIIGFDVIHGKWVLHHAFMWQIQEQFTWVVW